MTCRSRLVGERRVEEVIADQRCEAQQIRRRLVVEDVFGLARVTWEVSEATALTVLPFIGRLGSTPVVPASAAAEGLPHPAGAPEGDRMDIRRYSPGDSARHIMWKVFARTRQLNVRLPERSVERLPRTVAYLVAGREDEPSAAAARVALETGALGEGWVFGADGTSEPVGQLDEALQAIARSGGYAEAHAERDAETPRTALAAFLERAATDGSAHCVVFAPAEAGAWTEPALAAAAGYRGAVSWVLGVDGVARPSGPEPLWRRLMLSPAEDEGRLELRPLSDLLRRLGSVGTAVVVDRSTGKSWGERRLREAVG